MYDLSKISTNINNYVQGNKVYCFRQKRAIKIHNVHILYILHIQMLEIEDKKEGNLHIVTKEAYRQCTHVQVRNNHPLHRHFAHH